MNIAPMAEVKAHPRAYVKASEAALVVITRKGKPVAVLLPMEDDEARERQALADSKRVQAMLTEGRHQMTTSGGMSHADFWHEMDGEDVGAETPPAASRHQQVRSHTGTFPPRRARREGKRESPGNSRL